MKPVLFIGSSSESLEVAYAAQENLEDCAQPIVWTQDLFALSRSFLDSLLDALDESDFGRHPASPSAIGKSKADPSLRKSAGARLIVTPCP